MQPRPLQLFQNVQIWIKKKGQMAHSEWLYTAATFQLFPRNSLRDLLQHQLATDPRSWTYRLQAAVTWPWPFKSWPFKSTPLKDLLTLKMNTRNYKYYTVRHNNTPVKRQYRILHWYICPVIPVSHAVPMFIRCISHGYPMFLFTEVCHTYLCNHYDLIELF